MLLILILKIMKLSNWTLKKLKIDDNKIVEVDSKRSNKTVTNLAKSKKSNNNNSKNSTYIKVLEKVIILILDIKKLFNYLK